MMNWTGPGTSSPSERRFSSDFPRPLLAALLGIALLAPAGAGPWAQAAQAADGTALTAVETRSGGREYHLICRGQATHRLIQDLDGTLFTIELPGASNEIDPGELPPPAGPVRAISVGSDADGARLAFTLHRQAAAMVQQVEDGLVLRILDIQSETGAVSRSAMRPLGTEDLLEITVFEVPDLNRTVRVSETGTISLPLVGEIPASGLTPRDLEAEIRRVLHQGFVKDPHVSVFVLEHGSKKVSVLGAVGKPGVYEMLGPRSLLQVLAQAGGLTEDGGARIFVIRASPGGGHERIPVEVEALVTSEDPALNLTIEPGDVISVPRDRTIHIFVDGAVRTPGRIDQKASREITLMQAIAKAGGATDRANLKKVQILRKGSGGNQTMLVVSLHGIRKGNEPDPVLHDGDVVVVPETFF